MRRASAKGFFVSIEALLSLLIAVSLITIPISAKRSDFAFKVATMSDVFEVTEKGFHEDLAVWSSNGDLRRLQILLDFAKMETGLNLRLVSGQRKTVECIPEFGLDRLVVARDEWKIIRIELCLS